MRGPTPWPTLDLTRAPPHAAAPISGLRGLLLGARIRSLLHAADRADARLEDGMLHLPLTPRRDGTAPDAAREDHGRHLARRLRRAHCARLSADGETLILSSGELSGGQAHRSVVLGEIGQAVDWLRRFADPHAAWLTAFALESADRPDTIIPAACALCDWPRHAALAERVRIRVMAHPAAAVRDAALLELGTVDALDRAIAECVCPEPSRARTRAPDEAFALIAARWSRGPAPSTLTAWLADPRWAIRHAAAALPDVPLPLATRLALVEGPPGWIQFGMLSRPGLSDAESLVLARAILDRVEAELRASPNIVLDVIFRWGKLGLLALGQAGDILAEHGVAEDLARARRWCSSPWGSRARVVADALEARLGAAELDA